MPVEGSFAALRALRRQVEALKSPRFSDGLGKVLGAAAQKIVADEFQTESDPYSKRWEPLAEITKARRRKGRGKGGPKILQDTGRLKRSYTYSPAPGGFKITTDVAYAAAHQYGYKPHGLPARSTIPLHSRGLGDRWREPLKKAADAWIDKWFAAVKAAGTGATKP